MEAIRLDTSIGGRNVKDELSKSIPANIWSDVIVTRNVMTCSHLRDTRNMLSRWHTREDTVHRRA